MSKVTTDSVRLAVEKGFLDAQTAMQSTREWKRFDKEMDDLDIQTYADELVEAAALLAKTPEWEHYVKMKVLAWGK